MSKRKTRKNEESKISETQAILPTIDTPAKLRELDVDKLPQVCQELRDAIIKQISQTPGHFASSMGAVEITVALHYVFQTPEDRIVWDVGHQAYAHKLLTGRQEDFKTIRQFKGISGFPNPMESEYDSFMAGHAGNSISAALGMAIADSLTPGYDSRKTIAVIGDASIGCGLAFEGLNNTSNNPNDLLIILNDNDMSIDDNVGALHRYLSHLSTSPRYNRWRLRTYKRLKKLGLINDRKKGGILRFLNSIKSLVSGQQNIFEGLNIRYFGPFDGHDVTKLVKILQDIKDMKGPRLVHLRTVKGKGFSEAEQNPSTWHAPGKFDPITGNRIKSTSLSAPLKWQDVFGKTLVELAELNPDIVGITAAMPSGTSMNLMLERFPSRTFDVGISEGHAVTFAGGLASSGKHPFVAIYSSFLQRAYDNIIHDVAIQGLPVTFCIDRAGIVGEDGVTHHGMLDLAYLRIIPNMTVASPSDEETLRNLMLTAANHDGPMAIRYPRGNAFTPEWKTPMHTLEIGKGRTMVANDSSEIAILAIGPVATETKEILAGLANEGIFADLFDMIWLKPIDEQILKKVAGYKHIITIEDGTVDGGLGSVVTQWMNDNGYNPHIIRLGAPDEWIRFGTVKQLRKLCGYDAESIETTIRKIAQTEKAK